MNDSFQREERISIARILNQVVDQQHQNIVQFNNVSAALESIRTEIRRTDENHSKELERLHGIIRVLLPQQPAHPTPQQVYDGSATAANFFGGPVQPPIPTNMAYEHHRHLLQQQMALMSLQAYQRPAPTVPTTAPAARTEMPPMTPVDHGATSQQQVRISDSRDEISSDSSEGEPWDVDRTLDSEKKTDVSVDARPFSDFLKKNDQWECAGCYTCNSADAGKCVCCGTSKDGSKDEEKIFAKPTPSESASKFSFGLSAVKPSLKMEASVGATPTKPRVSFADAAKVIANDETPPVTPQKNLDEAPKLAFGAAATTPGNIFGGAAKVEPTKPTFSFSKSDDTQTVALRPHAGLLPSKPLFGTFPRVNKPQVDAKISSAPTKIFGSASANAFSFAKPTGESIFNEEAKKEALEEFSKLKTSAFGASEPNNAAEGNEEESAEDYEPTVEFTPVCPLPDLVEVVTGEENEKVVFEDRCKLYRYTSSTKEWKERGTGTIKILLDEAAGKARCVMRREQTHKLACNFRLTSEMTINKMGKNDKAAVWMCLDFSEENNVPEKFSAKFGNSEKTSEFINHFQQFCN